MPLFPAYATKDVEEFVNIAESQDMVWEATESREAQLLASDTEEEQAAPSPAPAVTPAPAPAAPRPEDKDFYLDCKLDPGNLRVSTLYYPGRPQYVCCDKPLAGGVGRSAARARRERRRYWLRRAADAPDTTAAAERAAAYRRLLHEQPNDVNLWERFIDFQEVCGGAEAALQAAEEAVEAAGRGAGGGRLRARLLAAARAALPRDRLLQHLRDMLAKEKSALRRVAVWEELVRAAAAGGAAAVRAAAVAALADTRAAPAAYPRLLHAYGVFLRAGGLWEELVLLIELVVKMTFPPAEFPPSVPASPSPAERRLQSLEDQVLASGLPLSTMWVRVERARAAAHWRPAAATALDALDADPQRAPLPHDLADLLQPLHGDRASMALCVTLLRLAKVPLLGSCVGLEGEGGVRGAAADCAEALLPLLRAARRLPPAHPARPAPAAARALLALLLDPPHYAADDSGYLSWVNSLWDACCGWVSGARRVALLCWRLRWLHALLLLVDPTAPGGADEVARIRSSARASLKRFGEGSPLAFAQFARLELQAGGGARAARVATCALRAAPDHPATSRHHFLYIARIVCEMTSAEEGARALVCAVLGRAPPPDCLEAPPPTADELAAALRICEERCEELERQIDEEAAGAAGVEGAGEDEDECAWLLPGAGEWGAAWTLLAAPPARLCRLRALLARAQSGRLGGSGEGARYWERSACALVAAAPAAHHAAAARALAPHFPHNAYLALASAGAPLWSRAALSQEERLRALCAGGAVAALAAPLPALLRALAADWAPQEAEACARALRRAEERAGAGVLLSAARLEAEGRAPRPRLPLALYAALDRHPAAKWIMVRGAAWCGGEAGALADLLLHRQLRAHALPDELHALAPAPPPLSPPPTDP